MLNQKKQARTNEAKARKLKKIAQKADQKAAKANAQIEALKLGGDAEKIVAVKPGPAKRKIVAIKPGPAKRKKQRKTPTVASKLHSTPLANGEEEKEKGAQPPGRKSKRVQKSNTAQKGNAKTTTAEQHLSFHGVVGERTRKRTRDAEIAS